MDQSAPSPGSSTGLEENTAAFLAVLLTWVGALVFYLVEKKSPFVRFYALQELALSLGMVALAALSITASFIAAALRSPFIGFGTSSLCSLIYLVAWIALLVNAYQGKVWELPLLGAWCRRQAGLP
ncbi:DUF4870 domain-containing protein [bacterium]|nr:DUF4870 domain-containing protein [bacterium]